VLFYRVYSYFSTENSFRLFSIFDTKQNEYRKHVKYVPVQVQVDEMFTTGSNKKQKVVNKKIYFMENIYILI
jgi:hypothetical protein